MDQVLAGIGKTPNEGPGFNAVPATHSGEGHEGEHTLAEEQSAHVVHTTGRALANQRAYRRHEVHQLLAH